MGANPMFFHADDATLLETVGIQIEEISLEDFITKNNLEMPSKTLTALKESGFTEVIKEYTLEEQLAKHDLKILADNSNKFDGWDEPARAILLSDGRCILEYRNIKEEQERYETTPDPGCDFYSCYTLAKVLYEKEYEAIFICTQCQKEFVIETTRAIYGGFPCPHCNSVRTDLIEVVEK